MRLQTKCEAPTVIPASSSSCCGFVVFMCCGPSGSICRKSFLTPMVDDFEFEWPKQEEAPSSKVITKVKDWCDASILRRHECIRWWHAEIRKVLEVYTPTDPKTDWKTDILFNFLEECYVQCISKYYFAEEETYFYEMEWRLKLEKKDINPNIKIDRDKLQEELDKIKEFRDPILEATDKNMDEKVHPFKEHINMVLNKIDGHLELKEEEYPSYFRQCKMTEQDGESLSKDFQNVCGRSVNKRFLPAMVYTMCKWRGEEDALDWASTFPLMTKITWNRWIKDFVEKQLKVFIGLQGNEEFVVHKPMCSCTLM